MPKVIAEVLYHDRIGGCYRKLGLSCAEVGSMSCPGQFVMVRLDSRDDPLLPRPFAIHRRRLRCRRKEGIEILYRVVGRGTRLLSLLRAGEEVELWGPLGRGFSIQSETEEHILIAGGTGVASIFALAEELSTLGKRPSVFLGGLSAGDLLCIDDFRSLNVGLLLSTEDGTEGDKGLVSESLAARLHLFRGRRRMLYASGPHALLKRIAEISEKERIPCQLSLESRMACGLGACLGCVVTASSPASSFGIYRRVCREGPVFEASEIDWERLCITPHP